MRAAQTMNILVVLTTLALLALKATVYPAMSWWFVAAPVLVFWAVPVAGAIVVLALGLIGMAVIAWSERRELEKRRQR